jgi:hypothetical protein
MEKTSKFSFRFKIQTRSVQSSSVLAFWEAGTRFFKIQPGLQFAVTTNARTLLHSG